jgi:hypothetical protein
MQPKIELTQAVELADFGLDEFLSQLSADSICIFLGDLLDLRRTSSIIAQLTSSSSCLILWRYMVWKRYTLFLFTWRFDVVAFLVSS